ncbi:MAG: hypothetical protein FWC40_09370 [Proteobacteria bacterium]|nr:hypothetical protein [Pseudomonadota bacterium]
MNANRLFRVIGCCILSAIVTVFVLVGSTKESQAQVSFTPFMCPQCPTWTEIPDWRFQVGTSMFPDLPLDPNCTASTCPHYINHLQHGRYIAGNSYIKQVGFWFESFNTEMYYDYFYCKRNGIIWDALTGTPTMPRWLDIPLVGTLQTDSVEFRFQSDHSITRRGFLSTKARVCCGSGGWVPIVMWPFVRYSGFLLGKNDVVDFIVGTAGGQLEQFVLWSNASSGNDFDVYIKCGSRPTPTSYDFRGARAGSHEFLAIPTGNCSSAWFVVVHAFSGSGTFNLVKQSHYPSRYLILRAGTNFNANSAQMTHFATILREGARHFYGATEGSVLISGIHLYNSNSCSNCGGAACNICFLSQNGGSVNGAPICADAQVCNSSGYIRMYSNCWNRPSPAFRELSHEFGHKYFCLRDEYQVNNGTMRYLCGHSIMAEPRAVAQNNFCYNANHKKDPSPGAPNTSLSSAWTQARNAGVTSHIPVETPDNYDYISFDHPFPGNVIIH